MTGVPDGGDVMGVHGGGSGLVVVRMMMVEKIVGIADGVGEGVRHCYREPEMGRLVSDRSIRQLSPKKR
jgi:hypothetical protein